MTGCSTADQVCLHLLESERGNAQTPKAATTEGILDGIGVESGAITGHFGVISALSTLEERGRIETRQVAVTGHDSQTVYELTDEGREHAREVAAELADREVTLRTPDGEESLSMREAADRLGGSLADAVARLHDDTLVLEGGEEPSADAESTPFVGRDADLAWLAARLPREGDGEDRAADVPEPSADATEMSPDLPESTPDVVRVTGEPGVGKTAFARAVGERVRERGGQFLFGACAAEPGAPYGPFLDAIAGLAPDRRDRIADLLTATADDDPEDAPGGEGASERRPDSPTELRERRESLFAEVATELRSAAAEGPVVLVLDDAHRSDRPTALLVAHVASELAADPFIAVATTYREATTTDDALADAFADRDLAVERLALEPLDREATSTLVSRLLGTRRVPGSFVDRVYDHTGGTPLFVVESVRRLRETGLVRPAAGLFPDADDDLPVPETVEQAVAARLDGLDDRTRELLETAALVGTAVTERLLVAASRFDAAAVRERVELLVASRLWTRTDDGRLRFVSDVVRETVRERVPAERRATVHRRVADAYRERGHRPADGGVAAARHYEAAGDVEAALEASLTAAEAAIDVYAHEVAIEACERAVDLARESGGDEAVVTALELLGDTYEATGEFDEAARCFGYVRDRADASGTVARMWTREGRIATKTGAFDRAQECFEQALAAHREADETAPEELADTLNNLAVVAVKRGDYEAARDRFAAVVERYRDLGDEVGAAKTLGNLGVVERRLGNYGAARDAHRRSLDVFRERGETNDAANALGNLGLVAMKRGALETARERYEECLARKRDVEEPRGQSRALHNLGTVARLDGALETARDYCERALEITSDVGDRHETAQVRQDLGCIERAEADYEAARDHLEAALEAYRDLGDRSGEAGALGELGVLSMATGDLAAAAESLADCVAAYADTGEVVERAQYLGVAGAVDVRRGDHETGREKLADALAGLADADSPLAAVTVLRHHVEAELAAGDDERARDLCERARDRIDRTDATLGAERERIEALCRGVEPGD